jgi:pimeloyl-ACP methyl ester carboxylesterase
MWIKQIVVCEELGLRMQAVEWSRRGPACVLLHGFGDNAAVWGHFAPRITPQFRTVTVDLRGHGNSDWDPKTRYDVATFTADLRKAVAALGFEQAILVGHSWGAYIALRFAVAHPGAVAALVLVDFGPELAKAGIDEVKKGFSETPRSFPSADEYVRWLAARRPLADTRLLGQFARYSLQEASDGQCAIKADAALGTTSEFIRMRPQGDRYCFPDLWEAIASIKCPCLVVRGALSSVFPRDVAARMTERPMTARQFVTIPTAGHAVMIDNPAEFSGSVSRYLSSLVAS